MFSIFNKIKQQSENASEEEKNQTSIEKERPETQEEITQEKISKFYEMLDGVSWDLNDDSSFYTNLSSEKREKKLERACESYGKGKMHDPILLVDTTTFGKADCGMMFTRSGIYIGESDYCAYFLSYESIIGKKFKIKDGSFYVNSREYSFNASKIMHKLTPVVNLLNTYFS
jgi:hypothetical protein